METSFFFDEAQWERIPSLSLVDWTLSIESKHSPETYRLKLPPGSRMHPVVYVMVPNSLRFWCFDCYTWLQGGLCRPYWLLWIPSSWEDSVKASYATRCSVLVKWKQTPDHDITYEFMLRFPAFLEEFKSKIDRWFCIEIQKFMSPKGFTMMENFWFSMPWAPTALRHCGGWSTSALYPYATRVHDSIALASKLPFPSEISGWRSRLKPRSEDHPLRNWTKRKFSSFWRPWVHDLWSQWQDRCHDFGLDA
jgi:hypothetical protein